MKNLSFDFLVIGSGVSGLNFALEAARSGTVAVVTKKELMESNSNYAQGGIAAVRDKQDSIESHIKDTLIAGCNINDKTAVEILVREASDRIDDLIELGTGFNTSDKKLSQTQEGGHSKRRILHAKDATGHEIERALIHNVRNNKQIQTFESHIAIDCIIENNRCIGVTVFNEEEKKNKNVETFFAKAVILTTGGAGQVYKRNSNPGVATGDGIAMGHRAGAKIRDMEFVQFHPTALAKKGKSTFLISETVRGEGGVLKNERGKVFMKKYHPQADLAPRDIVSRAIFEELEKGPVYLDIRHKGTKYIKQRFPNIYEQLWWYGIRMDKEMIPVAPAAHYVCGGVHTDVHGRTNIKGFFAVGEVAHTGVHGANRLASNSLLECMVFSHRAADAAKMYIKGKKLIKKKTPKYKYASQKNKKISVIKKSIQTIMWSKFGIVRRTKGMERALKLLTSKNSLIEALFNNGISTEIIELRNLHTVALLIASAALERKVSIGAHYIESEV